MIIGIFHQGSGLGNQLHRYIATRVLAADKGYEWGMTYKPDGSGKEEGFKGNFFINKPIICGYPVSDWKYFEEKKIVENGVDIRAYDPEFNFIEDNTIVEGEFQDERYFSHRLKEIEDWLKVEPLLLPDNLCVIGFRGGEYSVFPDLYLTKEYWKEAIQRIKDECFNVRFEVHTDDPQSAAHMLNEFLPVETPIIHDVGLNWRSVRFAKWLIIANSSFYIFPSLLNTGARRVFAPRYWARRNTGIWALPQNYYKKFTYI